MTRKVRILVVDDELVMRNLFTDILEEEGYEVTVVNHGKEAQEIVQREEFDIAFVDVHMPVMDGVKTLYTLRDIAPNIAIIMMDSMPEELMERFKKESAVTCIHKPFNIDEVRSVVLEIIKERGLGG